MPKYYASLLLAMTLISSLPGFAFKRSAEDEPDGQSATKKARNEASELWLPEEVYVKIGQHLPPLSLISWGSVNKIAVRAILNKDTCLLIARPIPFGKEILSDDKTAIAGITFSKNFEEIIQDFCERIPFSFNWFYHDRLSYEELSQKLKDQYILANDIFDCETNQKHIKKAEKICTIFNFGIFHTSNKLAFR